MEIKIGARPSPLAIRQAEEAIGILKRLYPDAAYPIIKIKTTGDIDKTTPISEVEGSDFFTKELDAALLGGCIDIAVHSSKDLPDRLADDLEVALETDSISLNDALISKGGLKFSELPEGARIGTSSKRRKAQVKSLRKDLEAADIRGNIGQRIALVDSGSIDALIVAESALIRLGLQYRASEILPLELFKTHPKQGSLSLVVRKGRWQKVKYI
jgi:hydroxymethylbilane synthase